MLQFIYLFVGLIVAGVIESALLFGPGVHMEAKIVVSIILFAIFVIWGCVLINLVRECISEQLSNLHGIRKLRAQKVSYEAELGTYKEEMSKELLERYREFETTLMEHVKDSKLIAAILQQSGYSDVLNSYNKKVSELINSINNCDRTEATNIADMQARQDDYLAGFGRFIPTRLMYTGQFDPEV